MNRLLTFILVSFVFTFAQAQNNPLEKFQNLYGKWEGTGSGFGSSTSVIHSEFIENFVPGGTAKVYHQQSK